MSNRKLHDWRYATVTQADSVADGVRCLVLDVPGCRSGPPGSHIDVLLPLPAGEVVRSYSVIDDGRHPGNVCIAVRLDHKSRGGSTYMHSLRAGDQLLTSPPVQTFELTWGSRRYVLLAGGIGITPIVGMARRLRTWRADYELVYVSGTRSAAPFIDSLIQDHPGRVRLHVGAEQGRLDINALVKEIAEDAELYVCGPISMLLAAQRAWQQHGYPANRLRFETFGSSGTAPAAAFTVRVPRLGVETLVPAEMTLLDALGEAGVEVMSDCERGECGLCEVTVLDHDHDLDHRDVFLSERQRSRGDKLCACVSRCTGGTLTIDVP